MPKRVGSLLLLLVLLFSSVTPKLNALKAPTTESRTFEQSPMSSVDADPVAAPMVPHLTVNIRRDTSTTPFVSNPHSEGLSNIVWGKASPNTSVNVTLASPGVPSIIQVVNAGANGDYAVSVDRLIAAGDTVTVIGDGETRIVLVPLLSVQGDPATRIFTGTAPAGITSVAPDAPHSLQISIAGTTRQLTTTASGGFQADLSARPYVAGMVGALRYVTPQGDHIFQPFFVIDPPARSQYGDEWADVILGQSDFFQITPNEVVANRIFNPAGLTVDRSVTPNRIYLYDSGNNRVLGLSHLGTCAGGVKLNQACTTDSDCPASSCAIDEMRGADLVLGQPDFNHSGCNGDSGFQAYPDVPAASATTLCGLREQQVSILEGGSAASIATDAAGNLYVPDHFNNRVLRYDRPFETDAAADYVWGQGTFGGINCNRGAGFGRPDARSLCLGAPPGRGEVKSGVAVDSVGNLWVADTWNDRVVRFPFNPTLGKPAPTADLVLGQLDLASAGSGAGMNQMDKPNSVRVATDGRVYVADQLNSRVLVFEPPFFNGKAASRLLGSGFWHPTGLEIEPGGAVWVNDTVNQRLVRYVDGVQTNVVTCSVCGWGEMPGGLGLDVDGNILVTAAGPAQTGVRFAAPSYEVTTQFLRPPEGQESHNATGPRGMYSATGVEVAGGQLIVADMERLLFWNNPWNLADGHLPDGIIGEPDFYTRRWYLPRYGRMRADGRGRLWVIHGGQGVPQKVLAYNLPVTSGASPVISVEASVPLKGGGALSWTDALGLSGIDFQPGCDCLWLSDRDSHRVFRITDVSTNPVVDIVIGQQDLTGAECNQGRGYGAPSQDSLCYPGALAFDRTGNLFVSDNNLEVAGNQRLLEYDASTLAGTSAATRFGIPATRIFGHAGSFVRQDCVSLVDDPMCGPWEPAFGSQGKMVVGFNTYTGWRFPMVYQDPLVNPQPVAALGDLQSMPLSAHFDQFDNLYVTDINRGRVLIYWNRPVRTFELTGSTATTGGAPISGVHVAAAGYAASGVTDLNGRFSLTGVVTGTYQITATKQGWVFEPESQMVQVPGQLTSIDFVGTRIPVTVTLSWPLDGAIVSGLVAVQGVTSGVRVELYLDDVLHGVARRPAPTWSWSTLQTPNGTHRLKMVPYDSEGYSGNSTVVTVTVSNPSSGPQWIISGLEGLTVVDVAVAPSDNRVVYASTRPSGQIFRSNDSGIFWTAVGPNLLPGADWYPLAVDPIHSNIVMAGSSQGVYKSTDGGDTWTPTPLRVTIVRFESASDDGRILYASGWGAFRTDDGGDNWRALRSGIWHRGIAADSRTPQTAYFGEDLSGSSGQLQMTTDGGDTWKVQIVVSTAGLIHQLAVDPGQPNIMYAGKVWGPGGVFRSLDGGVSWSASGLGGINVDAMEVAPGFWYVGSGWGGVLLSTDRGDTWSNSAAGLPAGYGVHAIAIDPTDSALIYAGLDARGVWKLPQVQTPTPIPTATPTATTIPSPTSTVTVNWWKIYLPLVLRGE